MIGKPHILAVTKVEQNSIDWPVTYDVIAARYINPLLYSALGISRKFPVIRFSSKSRRDSRDERCGGIYRWKHPVGATFQRWVLAGRARTPAGASLSEPNAGVIKARSLLVGLTKGLSPCGV